MRILTGLLMVMILGVLVACGSGDEQKESSPTPTETAIPPTETATVTPSPEPSHTPEPSPTASLEPSPSASPTEAEAGLGLTPIEHNADWSVVAQEFDGVAMVLVPVGCFMMGDDEDAASSPAHEQCIETPFWIDQYEVSNEQFERLGGVAAKESDWKGSLRARQNVTWFEAKDFCELRGGRLPSEVEWEYAARGPDGLRYPWGDTFVGENVVYKGNSQGVGDVGSYPTGASWAGALDMSGNIWEWTRSAYAPYPYDAEDGREGENGRTEQVFRGGSSGDLEPIMLMTTPRYRESAESSFNYIGFRCVRAIE